MSVVDLAKAGIARAPSCFAARVAHERLSRMCFLDHHRQIALAGPEPDARIWAAPLEPSVRCRRGEGQAARRGVPPQGRSTVGGI